jgi:NTE family protein
MNNSYDRALVLAGAGAAGNAWQLGIIAGLAAHGIDLTEAELIVGTSAGSTVAAQITSGVHPADLYAAILAEVPPPGRPQVMSGSAYVDWSQTIIDEASSAEEMRRALAAAALEKDPGDDPSRWRAIVASRLPSHAWPERRVLIPALDARTAQPVVFDRHSGIDLVDAVAASTSALTPYRIGEDRYLNGGYRRSSNADLAAGYGRVVVLEPFGGRSRTPKEWGLDLNTQVDELRTAGSRVEVVFPDAGAGDVFTANALDPSTRLPAAKGGYEQGLELAASLHFWR